MVFGRKYRYTVMDERYKAYSIFRLGKSNHQKVVRQTPWSTDINERGSLSELQGVAGDEGKVEFAQYRAPHRIVELSAGDSEIAQLKKQIRGHSDPKVRIGGEGGNLQIEVTLLPAEKADDDIDLNALNPGREPGCQKKVY